ncbi:MAG: adenylate/guanylate cyclase domain-containing protein [Acidimicrobiales bacterium]
MNCPNCGAEIAPDARFCSACGHSLHTHGDERRVVTIVFADLVGFTSLAEGRDPEQVKNLVDDCMERLAADIVSFGGQVDKVIGDAIVALFGAPVAHEDDAERAVRAALKMQASVHDLDSEMGVSIRMRIGLNTGEVLVGSIRADRDYTAMGDAVNTAARLQTAAEPGEVLVGRSTYDATSAVIRYESAGAIAAKGKESPVEAFRAIAPYGLPGERKGRALTPFVGREGELSVLRRVIDSSVHRERAALMLLLGDAGVGKTRLAAEAIEESLEDEGILVLSGRCVPYGEADAWWPLAEAMRTALGIDADMSLAAATVRVLDTVSSAFAIARDAPQVQRSTTGLLHLLGYDTALKSVDPQAARGEAGRGVRTFLQARAGQGPVILWLSDLHWADDFMLRMVDGLINRLARFPFVIVATGRFALSERWSPQLGRFNLISVSVDPLDEPAALAMLHHLLGPEIEPRLEADLLARSGGNPFFLEELAALVRDDRRPAGAPRPQRTELPSSLQALVSARLDGLPSGERGILEDAAVLGRRGTVNALRRMASELRGETSINDALSSLAEKDLLVVTRIDRGEWSFRSDLVRDVVYGRLTKSERARRHFGIADYLVNGDEFERAVDAIAYHYRRAAELASEIGKVAGLPDDLRERALDWLQKAATAASSSANLDAAQRLFGQALALARDDDGERRAELLLGRAKSAIEARELPLARADIAAATELTDETLPLLRARAQLYLGEVEQCSGNFERAVQLLRDAAARYRELELESGVAEALRYEGMTHLFAGRFVDAERCTTEALSIFQSVGNSSGEAWARQNLAWIAFVQGMSSEAESRLEVASQLFEELGNQSGLAWSRGLLAFVRMHQGRFDEAEEIATQALRDARERGDRWAEGMMQILRSAVCLWSGRTELAIRRAENALSLMRSIEDRAGEVQAAAFLGRALVFAGRVNDGFQLFADFELRQFGTEAAGVAQLVGAAAAASAIAIGDPNEARRWLSDVDPAMLDPALVGQGDRLVSYGMAALQEGDLKTARILLERAVYPEGDAGANSSAQAALALAALMDGEDDAVPALTSAVERSPRSTYADRWLSAVVAALLAARREDATACVAAIDRAQLITSQAEDRVARAVVALAQAATSEALHLPVAADAARRADDRIIALGVEAKGWRAAFATALG